MSKREREAQRRALLAHGSSDHYIDAELYDFEYHERLGDAMWYRGLARRTGPVTGGPRSLLELGAGTGRVTVPLLRDGHAVTALDRMRSMLDALARKLSREPAELRARARLELADMRSLPFADESFELVIAPFNTLQHLYTAEELLRCFREVARVLAPGGTFAFDVMLPDLDWLTWDPARRHALTPFVHPRTRERLLYSTNHSYDSHTQVCHIRIFYDEDTPRARARLEQGETPQRPSRPSEVVHLAHRQIFPEELRALLPAAGLALERLDGDFRGLRLSEEVESMVAVSHKAR